MASGLQLAGGAGASAAADPTRSRDGAARGGHSEADQTDEIWKYWIVSAFAPALPPKHRRALTDEIRRIAYRPTDGEHAEEVDEAAREYLSRYA